MWVVYFSMIFLWLNLTLFLMLHSDIIHFYHRISRKICVDFICNVMFRLLYKQIPMINVLLSRFFLTFSFKIYQNTHKHIALFFCHNPVNFKIDFLDFSTDHFLYYVSMTNYYYLTFLTSPFRSPKNTYKNILRFSFAFICTFPNNSSLLDSSIFIHLLIQQRSVFILCLCG